MKLTRCDRHPENEAVATLAIRVHSAGYRPILLNAAFSTNQSVRYFDMCADCRSVIRSLILFDEEDAAVSTQEDNAS